MAETASTADGPVTPRGLGRSYGDAAIGAEGGVVVLSERLDRFIDFDESSGTLIAEGGVSFRRILECFTRRGWFLPVTPGTQFVTLGGAIACDVHGKNHHADGSIGRFIDWVDLLLPSGETARCSRHDDPDLFRATVGGMGLTGIIVAAAIRLMPVPSAFVKTQTAKAKDLDGTLDLFEQRFNEHRYSVAWIDGLARGRRLGRGVLMGGDHATEPDLQLMAKPAQRADRFRIPELRQRPVPFDFPSFTLNPLTVAMFNAAYSITRRSGVALEPLRQFFYPLDAVHGWNRVYGKRGFQQYQFVIPFEAGRDGLRELMGRLAASKRASFLTVLKTLGEQGEGYLSFPRPGWTLTLDLPSAPGLTELLRSLDERVIELGGRRYLAKDASLTRESFERMYPDLDAFRSVRERVDPNRRLDSALARRLGL